MSEPQARNQIRGTGEAVLYWGFTLLSFGLLSMFTNFELDAAMVIKPFDLVALAVLPVMLLVLLSSRGLRLSGATLVIGAYLLIHSWSAFSLGSDNGMRESVQSSELFLFFITIHCLLDRVNWPALGKLFIAGLIILTIHNAAWHVSHGFYAGWKRLGDAKLAFLILPTILAAVAVARTRQFHTGGIIVAIVVVAFAILSGERKAQINLVLLAGVLVWYRYFNLTRFSLIAGLSILVGVTLASTNDYVAHQLTALAGLGAERFVTPAELLAGYVPTSMSNAQRGFAMSVARNLIDANLLFGIGTNGYLEYVKASFPGAAQWLIVGIHNEFLRVLVENGIVGFAAFCSIWLRAGGWFLFHARHMPDSHAATYLFFLFAFFIQVTFEGSGQELFLIAVFVALMPEIFSIETMRSARLTLSVERRGHTS